MKWFRHFILTAVLSLISSPAIASEQEILLWPEERFTAEDRQAETVEDSGKPGAPDRRVANVRVPTITIYESTNSNKNRAAVIICPGGGYAIEAIDKEGYEPARWFQDRGIVGIVLKYRLPQSTEGDTAPFEDISRAVRYVRHRASEWHIAPQRIGVMGFSAGGHLASTGATHFNDVDLSATDPVDNESSRPDFQVLIYPVISMADDFGHRGSRERLLGKSPTPEAIAHASNDLQVTKETPPAFLVHTSDDPVSCENSLRYAAALKKHGVPHELHLYERGGHGYGLRGINGPVDDWPHRLEAWLTARGLVQTGE